MTRSLQSALARIETETERMRKFDFTPAMGQVAVTWRFTRSTTATCWAVGTFTNARGPFASS